MKRKILYTILSVEAIICVILSFAKEVLPNAFSTIMAFPFEQISLGLRALSLSGTIGNIVAIALYLIFCLIPVAVLLIIQKRRKLFPEDILLPILSLVLFVSVYFLINPGMLGTYMGRIDSLSINKAVLGSISYSVLLGYAVLRTMRFFFEANSKKLQKSLAGLLIILNLLFVYVVFGAFFRELIDSFRVLRAGNVGNEHNLGTTYLFLILQYAVNALPYVLNILVVFSGLNLLKQLDDNRHSESAVSAANKLSRICALSLVIGVISNMSFNLLQLIFMKSLMVVKSFVQIPVASIVFVLAALLFAQYIKENKELKDDNDMFV